MVRGKMSPIQTIMAQKTKTWFTVHLNNVILTLTRLLTACVERCNQ